jgi:hypothetical protein
MGKKGYLPPSDDPVVEAKRNASRRYREKNRLRRRQWNDAWMETNADRYTYLRVQSNARRRRVVLCMYSNPPRCSECGFDKVDGLVLDHVANDGSAHRKELKINCRGSTGGGSMYEYVRRNGRIDSLQVLCANCNTIKQTKFSRLKTLGGNVVRSQVVEGILDGKLERDLST